MPEVKDPAIKLFGKTIQLSHLDDAVVSKDDERQQYCSGEIKTRMENEHVDDTSSDQSTSVDSNDDPKTPTPDKENPSKNTQKPPKPDKILPCPRCNSMDTKFCYYNNYNINQPRHFCKNCQRYWTAGGTMRNTPVGSGRRKNKSLSSASYYRHLIITDTCLKNNGSVLNFGSESSDVPICESMNQAFNFIEKSQNPEDDSSNLVENGGNNGLMNLQKYPVQIPCFPSSPWGYNSGFPVNFNPPPHYWGCTVQVQQSPWSTPMRVPLMSPNSPLGKHCRDPNDQNMGAKKLLWSSLGVSNDEIGGNLINRGVLSKAFKSKIDEKNEIVGSSLVNLQANPAALSRSLNFREIS